MDLETLFLSSMVRRGPLFLYPRDRLSSFRYVLRPLASFSLSLPRFHHLVPLSPATRELERGSNTCIFAA